MIWLVMLYLLGAMVMFAQQGQPNYHEMRRARYFAFRFTGWIFMLWPISFPVYLWHLYQEEKAKDEGGGERKGGEVSVPEQWLPSASDQDDRLPIEEDVTRAYIDGRNDGRREECARIRRELLALVESRAARPFSGGMDSFRSALDRICPEGKE